MALIDNLFSMETVQLAIKLCNFSKALGEDWLCGDLLNNEKMGSHLYN